MLFPYQLKSDPLWYDSTVKGLASREQSNYERQEFTGQDQNLELIQPDEVAATTPVLMDVLDQGRMRFSSPNQRL